MKPRKRFYILEKKQFGPCSFLSMIRYRIQHERFGTKTMQTVMRWLIQRPAAVVVIPYDPVLDAVMIIQQFRVGAMESRQSAWQWEWVAGINDRNESMQELAKRELYEEAGLVAQSFIPIHTYWVSPGYTNEEIHMYCAITDLSGAGGVFGVAAEHEDIYAKVIPRMELERRLHTSQLDNGSIILGSYWLLKHYRSLQAGSGSD
ncbi:NUDIX domain-containing protein [Gammaproteobacteria bacterium]|nr:NUDIX domain-containing protein [Gammaproteobacteria bacterium]